MSEYRVFVELHNGSKFRAHGDVTEVRVDLERFYALLNETPKAVPVTSSSSMIETVGIQENAEQPTTVINGDGLDQGTLDRLFSKDKHGTVSLRALPRGDGAEGDALVALIYGAGRLAGEQQVTGSRLMKAAQQSGLHQVDRIDRSLNAHIGPYVTTAGFKKGRRYGLTNPGIRRAEEILTAILG